MESLSFYCIADPDTVRGFRSAGVAGEAVETADAATQAMEAACARPDVGVVVVTAAVAQWMRPLVESIRLTRPRPLIAEIPGPSGPLAEHRTLQQQVQATAGLTLEWKEPL